MDVGRVLPQWLNTLLQGRHSLSNGHTPNTLQCTHTLILSYWHTHIPGTHPEEVVVAVAVQLTGLLDVVVQPPEILHLRTKTEEAEEDDTYMVSE